MDAESKWVFCTYIFELEQALQSEVAQVDSGACAREAQIR